MGEEAIENFKDIALETGEPRAFEVLATLLKNTGELVKNVAENSKNKSEIDKNLDKNITPQQVQHNNYFVGSTKELLDKITDEEKVIDGEIVK